MRAAAACAPLLGLLVSATCGAFPRATTLALEAALRGDPAPAAAGLEPAPGAAGSAARSGAPSALALRSPFVNASGTSELLAARNREAAVGGIRNVLTADRARILLRSLTVPGWGQATIGKNGSAVTFGLVEAGIWTAYTSFRVQERLRRNAYVNTARLFAGVDLGGRDEEFMRIVGAFPNSELYNILVVRREAANRYFGDPAAYNAYIAEHQLTGANSWAWVSPESFERYRSQRQRAQRAAQRANTALAAAVANRLLSAIHAARLVHRGGTAAPTAPQLGVLCEPGPEDPTEIRLGLNARF